MWLKFLILGMAFFCVACGNRDIGAEAQLKAKSQGAGSSTTSASLNPASASLPDCRNFSVAPAGDSMFNTLFSGSSVCAVKSARAQTTVKVKAYSSGSRFCLIPVKGDIPQAETCFTTNGYSVPVNLQNGLYDALVLVPEIYIASYKMYLNGQTTTAPPLAVAVF